MRVRQIGSLVFDADTNIVVDAGAQDAPGIGFRVNGLYDPQPFSVEVAFRRATRQQALDAVSSLARELHSYAQRRQGGCYAVAGGVLVLAEDAAGGATLRAYLRDSSVALLSVEAATTGVIARVRVAGTLINPFLNYTSTVTSVSSLLPYERRAVTLVGTSDAYVYKNSFSVYPITNLAGLYNALIAVEELESATGTSRIQAINLATVTGGITTQNWNAGWATLTRANFSSATSGTITYTINTSFPHDVYRLFIEIFCLTAPSSNARYLVSWDGQPQISETIVGGRSWYMPALFVRSASSFSLTLEVQNVPTGTLVMPLVLIPTDGVSVWNVVATPTLQAFNSYDPQLVTLSRPLGVTPAGTVYGTAGFISSRYIAVFNGMMASTITGASADWSIVSNRIEPAASA